MGMRVKRTVQFLIFVHSDWGEMNLMVVFLSISELVRILNALKRYFLAISISSLENSAQICSHCLLRPSEGLLLTQPISLGYRSLLVYEVLLVTCCPSFLSEWGLIQKVLPAPVSVGHCLCSLFQQLRCSGSSWGFSSTWCWFLCRALWMIF